MKGTRITYSAEELAWIKAHSTLLRKEAYAQFQAKFGREEIRFVNFTALCNRRKWATGRTGRIEPGNIPANKGKKMPFNANNAATQFKKGQLPHNTKHLGHERITKDGYVEISVNETNPHTGYERRYVQKHKYLWEQQHGKVPEGMCLKCLDGNRQNTDPSNWEVIQRGALPFLNGHRGYHYDTMPDAVKPAVLNLAKVKAMKKQVLRGKLQGRDSGSMTPHNKAPP